MASAVVLKIAQSVTAPLIGGVIALGLRGEWNGFLLIAFVTALAIGSFAAVVRADDLLLHFQPKLTNLVPKWCHTPTVKHATREHSQLEVEAATHVNQVDALPPMDSAKPGLSRLEHAYLVRRARVVRHVLRQTLPVASAASSKD